MSNSRRNNGAWADYMFAELLAASRPGISAINANIAQKKVETRTEKLTCAQCGKENDERKPLQACATCKSVRYCNKACQTIHYKSTHKIDCAAFKDPPLCQVFNTKAKNIGCEYPKLPILARGYEQVLGCWFGPSGNIDCTLAMSPTGSSALQIPNFPGEDASMEERLNRLPGAAGTISAGMYMGSLVLVQNRNTNKAGQDVVVVGRMLLAVLKPNKRDAILEGKRSDPDVIEKEIPGGRGIPQWSLAPCYAKALYFNGRLIKKGEKCPQVMNEKMSAVVLKPGEYVIFEVQWRAGNPGIQYDYQVWDAIHHIEVPFLLGAPTSFEEWMEESQHRDESESNLWTANAVVDHDVVDYWYKDFVEKGRLAYIESHYGKERRRLIEVQNTILQQMIMGSSAMRG